MSTLALIAVDGLSVIEFLMSRDMLIGWPSEEDHKERAKVAFAEANAVASRLAAKYPLPPNNDPESRQENASFFRQLIEKAVEELRNEDASNAARDT